MQRRDVRTRSLFLGLAVYVLGGCATTDAPDSGWNVADTGRSDATAMMDTAPPMDAARDVPIDRGTTTDTGTTTMDVPRDVPRDVPVDVPIDRGTTTDTGGGHCPSSCVNDIDCMSMCPAAGAGYVNCCLAGTGGGTCFQYMGSLCPSAMPTDAGSSGSDSGFPLGGGPGSPCAADTDCSMGSTCCLMFSPGFGICGCAVPIFGCIPPSGGSC